MAKKLIFLVDDDPHFLDLLAAMIRERGYEVETMGGGDQCLEALDRNPSVIFLDVIMPGLDGMETLKKIMAWNRDIPVIMLTSLDDIDTAVNLLKLGAYDYILKPVEETRLFTDLENAIEQGALLNKVKYLQGELSKLTHSNGIIGKSSSVKEVLGRINKLRDTRAGVLIQGESGTGKELVAQAIHQSGRFAEGQFIDINCGAIPESLQESELFGHKKGAFTGATANQPGKLELADGGTLFLDEVPEMSPSTQVKLLRFLQDKSFTRVGEHKKIQVDTRIVAATNKDLKALVDQGKFREDLYYRLAVFPITVPPLRERKEDIPLLCAHFLQKYQEELGKDIRSISDDAMQALLNYPWPGNIRQLENALYQAMIITTYDSIDCDCLPEEVLGHPAGLSQSTVSGTGDEAEPNYYSQNRGGITETEILPYHEIVKQTLRHALDATQGNIPKAAEKLRISRSTFYRMLKKYQLH